jgi:hypothetical protein
MCHKRRHLPFLFLLCGGENGWATHLGFCDMASGGRGCRRRVHDYVTPVLYTLTQRDARDGRVWLIQTRVFFFFALLWQPSPRVRRDFCKLLLMLLLPPRHPHRSARARGCVRAKAKNKRCFDH